MIFHWTPRRKANVVWDVRQGNITFDGACKKYDLTNEELTSWIDGIEKYGIKGLRSTVRHA